VALADGADSRLAYDGESLHEKVVHVLALIKALFELDGLAANSASGQGLDLGSNALIEGTMAARLRTFLLSPARSTFPNTLTTNHCTPPPLLAPGRRRAVAVSGLALQPATTGIRPADAAVSAWSDRDERPSKMVRRGSLDADVDEGTRGDVLAAWRAKCTSFPWRVRPLSTFGSFLEDPRRPLARRGRCGSCLRASADRSITTLSRSKRSAMTSAGTYISVIWPRACPPWARK